MHSFLASFLFKFYAPPQLEVAHYGFKVRRQKLDEWINEIVGTLIRHHHVEKFLGKR
jgi:hypothetical protein